ncbi:MAG: hypothetical protein ACKO3R_08365, partial [bacterium]
FNNLSKLLIRFQREVYQERWNFCKKFHLSSLYAISMASTNRTLEACFIPKYHFKKDFYMSLAQS